MKYNVIVDFTDLQDNNFKYRAGDLFPRKGLSVSEERIEALTTNKNRRGFPVIKAINNSVEEPEEVAEEPVEEATEELVEEPEEIEEILEEKPEPKKGGRKKADAK